MSNSKVLVVSHGHPDLSKGGAEVAAYNLYSEYKKRGIESLFLARTDIQAHGGSTFSTRNDENDAEGDFRSQSRKSKKSSGQKVPKSEKIG